MAAIKSFFSSLTSFSGKIRSSARTPAPSFKAEKTAYYGNEAAKYYQSPRYYDLDEAYVLQNGVPVDNGRQVWVPFPPDLPVEGTIVRIVGFDQTVRPSAAYMC